MQNNPSDVSTLKQLANLYLAIDSVPRAVALTEKYLMDFDTNNADVVDLNARANYFAKNYRQAANQYTTLEKLGVTFDQNQSLFAGICHFMLDENYPSDAVPYFMQADSLMNGGSYPVKYYIAKSYDNMGRWAPAYDYYKQAYDLIKPDTTQLVQILNKLGVHAMRHKESEKAIGYYLQVLNLNNLNDYALISLAMAYEYQKDYENALKYYRRLQEIPGVTEEYGNRAKKKIAELTEKRK